jgi:5-methylcytosine-specific restriction endonuclease McrA
VSRNQRFYANYFVDTVGTCRPKADRVSRDVRRAVFDRDDWHCQYCGQEVGWVRSKQWPFNDSLPVGHVDHFIPRARGGSSDMDNLILACEGCNSSKAAD